MPTVGILALGLVYLFFPLSTCPLQVCLSSFVEPCVWIHSSHAIWCQQAPSATLIHSQNSPRSVSGGSNLKDGQVSQKCCLKLKITSWNKKTQRSFNGPSLLWNGTKLNEAENCQKKVNWKPIFVAYGTSKQKRCCLLMSAAEWCRSHELQSYFVPVSMATR